MAFHIASTSCDETNPGHRYMVPWRIIQRTKCWHFYICWRTGMFSSWWKQSIMYRDKEKQFKKNTL